MLYIHWCVTMQECFLTTQEILMDDMVARFSVHAADRHWIDKWIKFLHIEENGNEGRVKKDGSFRSHSTLL